MTKERILTSIVGQLQSWKVGYRDVYVGVTANAQEAQRRHSVLGHDYSMFVTFAAESPEDAWEVAAEMMAVRGCDGPAEGPESEDERLVYVFVKSPTTIPSR